jgi:hypothetical protein
VDVLPKSYSQVSSCFHNLIIPRFTLYGNA